MKIRPVSDLRNNFPLVEAELRESGAIYLTKNGYASAVLLGVDEYTALTGNVYSSSRKANTKSGSGRGFLSKYANPELVTKEKDAGRMHAIKKYGGAK